ncbi:MAG: cold-shock protein [Aurantimonas coralicida]|jgi:CspA family cold shock protein|uniref:cold-shock protein n=1 Tax=Aurantimonas TaxID=182269 RepID=UPI000414D1F7|nr:MULTISPECIES: cold-shock protein [Aurantimonas]MAP18516.1 cold-shock protein [Aurantimonas sp.]MBC6716685.1 CspA family cold shock protein [Aurantimonas sp. DM33-3]MCD1643447.1 CspA family cold shock protein [Aurantimonas coralicida]
MGKYRDHRDTRRRGFDDDGALPAERDAEPSYFQRSSPAGGSGGSLPSDAEVMWFNATKGFGFVKAADGTEAFLHVRALEAAGASADGVTEGTRLTVRIDQGQKGMQVTEVLSVAAGSGNPAPARARPAPQRQGGGAPGGPEEEATGTVKWYNADKGFGFIGLDDGAGKDVFVHATALNRSGLTTLADGQKVTVRFVQGNKGPEARTLSAD